MLDTLGLSSAIRSLASEWTTLNGIKTQLNLCPDQDLKPLPIEVSVNLFRVAQEALSNITKHAHADQVNISLSFERSQLVMTIEDDGTGFNAPDTLRGLTQQSHYGLAGMRERMDLIGGTWSIKSAPGEGTIVRVVYVDNESHSDGK
jgi:signal transduction histidine kinase